MTRQTPSTIVAIAAIGISGHACVRGMSGQTLPLMSIPARTKRHQDQGASVNRAATLALAP